MRGRFIILFLLTATVAGAQHRLDSLIEILSKEVDQQEVYVDKKKNRIAALQERLKTTNTPEESFGIYNDLYHEYKTFINDSAFKYAHKLIQTSRKLDDEARIGYAHLKYGFALLSAGMFKETFDTLRAVNTKLLPDTSLVEYYRLSARAYADLMIYNNNKYFTGLYRQYYLQYMDSAFAHCTPDDYVYHYLSIVRSLHLNNYKNALKIGEELNRQHKLTHAQAAVYYYDMAEAYRNLGDEMKGLENLTLSSISDIRGSVKETAAMYTLARLLHQRGDSHHAYIFIRQALRDAQFYGARQRQVEINSILPLIAADQLNSSEAQRKRWVVYSAGITLIVIIVVALLIIIFKQLRKIRAADAQIKSANHNLKEFNEKLVEANKIKEEYVGYYFNMTTDYVNRIDSLRKQIMNFLVNDKKKEALAMLGKYNPGEERAKFVKDFDQVFLKLFPDFVHQFNQLLNPAEPLLPENENELNPDLRIFALIRLGIHDNRKIGEILNFSVNTVYAYKTRVKNKSIVPGEDFMNRIMTIKSVGEEPGSAVHEKDLIKEE
jgi:hypothetical protein